ncbi:hypothetical protein ACTWJ8_32090 [Streptomyces sp. SDT5-1]|uniref:hypothetical protein n=1 Tax=Streptomyces sp. SDT5-1 TaxID=3406418 RepID=UPI003FD0B039
MALQLATAAGGSRTIARGKMSTPTRTGSSTAKSVQHYLATSPSELRELYADLDALLLSHRGVVREAQLHYFSYRRIKNVATVRIQPRNKVLVVNLRLNPDVVELREGFTRDLRGLGNLGLQGDAVDVRIAARADLDRAARMTRRSIEGE